MDYTGVELDRFFCIFFSISLLNALCIFGESYVSLMLHRPLQESQRRIKLFKATFRTNSIQNILNSFHFDPEESTVLIQTFRQQFPAKFFIIKFSAGQVFFKLRRNFKILYRYSSHYLSALIEILEYCCDIQFQQACKST